MTESVIFYVNHVYVQVTAPSCSHRNYDYFLSGAKEEEVQHYY